MKNHIEKDKHLINSILEQFPIVWDGRIALIEMKNSGDKNWRQMEWIGFYAEFLFRKILSQNSKIRSVGDQYGNTKFDFSGHINWDLKSHPNSTPGAILNDCEAVDMSIKQHGVHGLIIICLDCEYDCDGDFKKWHDLLKGKTSEYEKARIMRGAPSRKRKVTAKITDFKLILLDESNISHLGKKQEGWRNSNGTARRAKYYISKHQIECM